MFIAGEAAKGLSDPFRAVEAISGAALEPEFHTASADQVEQALAAAAIAPPIASSHGRQRTAGAGSIAGGYGRSDPHHW